MHIGLKESFLASAHLLTQIRACTVCAKHLPHEVRPVVRGRLSAVIKIVGQAPGTKVHASGIPWDDRSGDVLRGWLEIDETAFYDEAKIAITPMGFCFPGQDKQGGDLPPRPECAPLWHPKLEGYLKNVRLTLLVGSYAQKYYLGARAKKTLTETVKNWREYLPEFIVLPHPSWRNQGWVKKNPWFTKELLPELRGRVAKAMKV